MNRRLKVEFQLKNEEMDADRFQFHQFLTLYHWWPTAGAAVRRSCSRADS